MPLYSDEGDTAEEAGTIDLPETGYINTPALTVDTDWYQLDLDPGTYQISVLTGYFVVAAYDDAGVLQRGIWQPDNVSGEIFQKIRNGDGSASYDYVTSLDIATDTAAYQIYNASNPYGDLSPAGLMYDTGLVTLEGSQLKDGVGATGEYYLRVEGVSSGIAQLFGLTDWVDHYLITEGDPSGQRDSQWGSWVPVLGPTAPDDPGTDPDDEISGPLTPEAASEDESSLQKALDVASTLGDGATQEGGYIKTIADLGKDPALAEVLNDNPSYLATVRLAEDVEDSGWTSTAYSRALNSEALEAAGQKVSGALTAYQAAAAAYQAYKATGDPYAALGAASTKYLIGLASGTLGEIVGGGAVSLAVGAGILGVGAGPLLIGLTVGLATNVVVDYTATYFAENVGLLPRSKASLKLGEAPGSPAWRYNIDTDQFTWLDPTLESQYPALATLAGINPNPVDLAILGDQLASTSDDYLIGGAANDTIDGGDGNDVIEAGPGDDAILGRAGDDLLVGDAGNDLLNAGPGTNWLDGGAGVDTAAYGSPRAFYTITRNADGTVRITGPGVADTLSGVEWARFSDGTATLAKVASDFDGNGKSDVLMENDSGQVAAWFAGTTSLSSINTPLDAGWQIRGTGDFNGDGKTDILLQHSSGVTEVWLMSGSELLDYADFNPGGSWKVKGAGDFDGNGKSDVLMQNDSGQMALWLAGASSLISFGSPLDAGWTVKGAADVNGDGKSDLLLQHSSGVTEVWVMNGANPQGYIDLNPGSSWMVRGAGDFNGDGKSDVLMQNSNGQLAGWFAGMSSLSNIGSPLDAGWTVKDPVDVNGDGNSDILLQHSSGVTEAWVMNAATPQAYLDFNPGSGWTAISGTSELTIAKPATPSDFDGDGRSDILMENGSSQVAAWFAGTTSLSNINTPLDAGWQIRGTGDFNGDGKSDILLQHSSGVTEFWLMSGSELLDYADFSLGGGWTAMSTHDFDGDGKSDVLMESGNGQMGLWFAGASTVTDFGSPLDAGWAIKGTGDFNGDGQGDILLQHSSGVTEIWMMNGAVPQSYVDLTPGDEWTVKGAGDFNGDGKSDVLMQNTGGQIAAWFAGASSLTDIGAPLDPGWRISGTDDVNGDGESDVLLQHSSGVAEAWVMSGASAQSYIDFNPGSSWIALAG